VLKLPETAGAAGVRLAIAATALIASVLVSLLALTPHLHLSGTVAPGGEADGRQPVAADASGKAEAGTDVLVRRLSAHLERQPRDARVWTILARLQFEMEHFSAAVQAYEKALALPSKVARDPAVWCEYADALGMTQRGNLAGKPRELIDRALALNPNHPKALEMAGSAEYAQGDYASALLFWRPLLALLEPESQAHAELAAAITRAERLAIAAIPARRQ
jgi:cytochrome c-type biogenesis protein CcmH/NrfG